MIVFYFILVAKQIFWHRKYNIIFENKKVAKKNSNVAHNF